MFNPQLKTSWWRLNVLFAGLFSVHSSLVQRWCHRGEFLLWTPPDGLWAAWPSDWRPQPTCRLCAAPQSWSTGTKRGPKPRLHFKSEDVKLILEDEVLPGRRRTASSWNGAASCRVKEDEHRFKWLQHWILGQILVNLQDLDLTMNKEGHEVWDQEGRRMKTVINTSWFQVESSQCSLSSLNESFGLKIDQTACFFYFFHQKLSVSSSIKIKAASFHCDESVQSFTFSVSCFLIALFFRSWS